MSYLVVGSIVKEVPTSNLAEVMELRTLAIHMLAEEHHKLVELHILVVEHPLEVRHSLVVEHP